MHHRGDAPEAERLRSLVDSLGLSGRVRMIGPIGGDDLVTQLSRCRAVVFPAQAEDYGLVTVEAFARRRPW